MLKLPPSLTRHFLDASGNFDHQALLRTPDDRLAALARQIPYEEMAALYRQLVGLRLSWLERMMAQAAGVDLDAQRRRFLRILEDAVRVPAPSPAASPLPRLSPGVSGPAR